MKRLLMASLGFAFLLAGTLPVQAQIIRGRVYPPVHFRAGRGKAKITLNGKTVSIDYGRPSLHGGTVQQILAIQPPTGIFWRLVGANFSTTFSTEAPLAFGNMTIPVGTYSLWTEHSGNDHWQLVFNKQHGQWGTRHDPKLDFAKVPLREEKVSDSVDLVTIKLAKAGSGARLSIQWGDLMLVTHFTAK